MTTSPSEPVENDQSGSDDDSTTSTQAIEDSQLPEDVQPGPDNPLASEDSDVGEAPKPDDDDAVPDGEAPPGEPSIG
ncbi:MAG: hypothetical protein ABJA81_08235 [Nocardioidaceae bacterium]